MTEADTAELEDLGRRWAQAEVAQDLATLAELAHPDFLLVGPLGFVLDREQWLDRYASGDFVTTALDWRDLTCGSSATRRWSSGSMINRPRTAGSPTTANSEQPTCWSATPPRWQLVGMHLSPIAAPPGRPPQQN